MNRVFVWENRSVTSDEILARIDRTLERMDARQEAGDRRWEEEQRRWAERDREQRAFFDGLLTRSAAITEAQIVGLQEFQREMSEELADQRAQIRANTEAVLRLLDERFGPEHPQG
jgi:multidrug resistance efflux pump